MILFVLRIVLRIAFGGVHFSPWARLLRWFLRCSCVVLIAACALFDSLFTIVASAVFSGRTLRSFNCFSCKWCVCVFFFRVSLLLSCRCCCLAAYPLMFSICPIAVCSFILSSFHSGVATKNMHINRIKSVASGASFPWPLSAQRL